MEYLRNSTDEDCAQGQGDGQGHGDELGQGDGQGQPEDSTWLHRCKILGISHSFCFLHFLGFLPEAWKAI